MSTESLPSISVEPGSIAVTGAGGFIGAHLVRALSRRGSRVFALDVESALLARLGPGDADPLVMHVASEKIDSAARLKILSQCSVVVHLAASTDMSRGLHDRGREINDAVALATSVCDAVVSGGGRLIFASSAAVYGQPDEMTPCDESSTPLRPTSMYGAAKMAGEATVRAYASLFDLPVQVIRPTTVLGLGLDRGVVAALVAAALRGQKPLRVLGDGTQVRNFVHIRDVVSAIETLLGSPHEGLEVYNVASDGHTTVREVADIVSDRAGGTAVEYGSGGTGWKGDAGRVTLSNTRLRGIGWHPSSNSSDTVRDVVEGFFREGVVLRSDEMDRARNVSV